MIDPNYYYCKCSICFENDSEMELINCGDQFCLTCLERYVEYWIKEGSWGLLPSELSCPVCATEMLDDDWMPYISTKLLDLWHKFRIKRREALKDIEISRPCPNCNHLQPLIGGDYSSKEFLKMGEDLVEYLDSSSLADSWRMIFGLESVFDLIQEVNESDADDSGEDFDISDFLESSHESFKEFIELIEKLKTFKFFKSEEEIELIRLLMRFGRMFLHFISRRSTNSITLECGNESDEECDDNFTLKFINLQLNFQLTFPFGHCDKCNLDFCLPCQSPTWFHPTCNMILADGQVKQCPRCFISIEKDSEGCNEMKCNYCGMKFCWECGKKWSKNCGIYKCKQMQQVIEEQHSIKVSDIPRSVAAPDPITRHLRFNTEIGVPNVNMIHKR